jgi:hypothetical protein
MRKKRIRVDSPFDDQTFLISRTKIQISHNPPVTIAMMVSNTKLRKRYFFFIRFPFGWSHYTPCKSCDKKKRIRVDSPLKPSFQTESFPVDFAIAKPTMPAPMARSVFFIAFMNRLLIFFGDTSTSSVSLLFFLMDLAPLVGSHYRPCNFCEKNRLFHRIGLCKAL